MKNLAISPEAWGRFLQHTVGAIDAESGQWVYECPYCSRLLSFQFFMKHIKNCDGLKHHKAPRVRVPWRKKK